MQENEVKEEQDGHDQAAVGVPVSTAEIINNGEVKDEHIKEEEAIKDELKEEIKDEVSPQEVAAATPDNVGSQLLLSPPEPAATAARAENGGAQPQHQQEGVPETVSATTAVVDATIDSCAAATGTPTATAVALQPPAEDEATTAAAAAEAAAAAAAIIEDPADQATYVQYEFDPKEAGTANIQVGFLRISHPGIVQLISPFFPAVHKFLLLISFVPLSSRDSIARPRWKSPICFCWGKLCG